MSTFASVDIHLPEQYREYFHMYCLTRAEGTKNDPEDSPFPRMVDMWFFAICLAVNEGLTPNYEAKGDRYKAINGDALLSDPWRCNILLLLAVAETDDVEVVNDHNEVVRVANAFALAGLPRLISLLNHKGSDVALDYLSDLVQKMTMGDAAA